ncbi:MAG: DUF2617 family protein [Candidatus Nitrohelix vancouverensis]|uniref:DUF2617 family protein n=1 Tax=Candidatus Nitrohelix vancouverensis TaxID=2705534 RepID=A0A7T0C235_9BACT|nr:MAG: DUF2617 family protein [Candidatus Nitrohelix vancouverensis]
MDNQISFSLFRGFHDAPVSIFKRGAWALANGSRLDVAIIGQSHRIISQSGREVLTEFIACGPEQLVGDSIDQTPLQPGATHENEFTSAGFKYHYRIEVVNQLYIDMDAYRAALPTDAALQCISHGFENPSQNSQDAPFTGIAIDVRDNRFFTIHTYPENGFSILSETRISSRNPAHMAESASLIS